MWVITCEQTGVEHVERFEFRKEAEATRMQLETDDWQGFTYKIRLEA